LKKEFNKKQTNWGTLKPIDILGGIMKIKIIGAMMCAALLLGCDAKTPQNDTKLAIHQLMEWVIDPNADVIWDSVKTISNIKGTTEIYPRTEAEWDAVRNSAATLIEAGNMLTLQGRAKDQKQWTSYARLLSKTAESPSRLHKQKIKMPYLMQEVIFIAPAKAAMTTMPTLKTKRINKNHP
jgi:hypothetical protein